MRKKKAFKIGLKYVKVIKFFHSLILLLFLSQFSFSQVKHAEPYLAKRFEIGGSDSENMAEYGWNISVNMHEVTINKLVIRLCSKEPLPVAIATAAVEPLTLEKYLNSSKGKTPISSKRMFVDRSETCDGKLKSNTATELWLLNERDHLPDSKEEISICQVYMQELKSKKDNKRGIFVGTYSDNLALRKLKTLLKSDSQMTGVVIGYYNGYYNYDPPTTVIKKKLDIAKRFLEKSGLPKDRYEVRLMQWTGFPDIIPSKYLSVRTIKITKECSGDNGTNKVVWVD